MNNKTKIALGGGLVAVFLAICFVAFNMGKNNASGDSPSVLMPDVGGSTYSSLDGVDTLSDEMRLDTFHGTLSLGNNGTEKTPIAGSRLVSGDTMETMAESQAYVVLDQSKVLRVNQTSQVEVRQVAEDLDIYLGKGSVFFNVTSPLSVDETLEFHTGNVVTGVRGTAGVISASEKYSQVAVLAGTVICVTTAGENFTVEAGQVAIVTSHDDGSVTYQILSLEKENLLFFLPDDFINTIQGDLNGEANSVPLSETLRKPLETKTTGKVLALSQTVAIEDSNGNLLTFDNSGGQSWSGVTLGGMVNLSYAEGRVISMEQTSQGADVIGAYIEGNFSYSNSLTPRGSFLEAGSTVYWDLEGVTNLSQAEKEIFLARMTLEYLDSTTHVLGTWADLEADANAAGETLSSFVEGWGRNYGKRSNPVFYTGGEAWDRLSLTGNQFLFTQTTGNWGTFMVYRATLNEATGQYSMELVGGAG